MFSGTHTNTGTLWCVSVVSDDDGDDDVAVVAAVAVVVDIADTDTETERERRARTRAHGHGHTHALARSSSTHTRRTQHTRFLILDKSNYKRKKAEQSAPRLAHTHISSTLPRYMYIHTHSCTHAHVTACV